MQILGQGQSALCLRSLWIRIQLAFASCRTCEVSKSLLESTDMPLACNLQLIDKRLAYKVELKRFRVTWEES
jgi:hypothetical protein